MKKLTLLIAISICLLAAPASAHHVVWLDFSTFNLSAWGSVNGNTPPTASDVAAVKSLVIANMTEDYAPFDIYFTTAQPPHGRYTRVYIFANADPTGGGAFGCAGPDCCPVGGNCSGIGTWNTIAVSTCEVYSGSFATSAQFSGANATTARIANGISHTASHELGHVLALRHCNAADDSMTLGCDGITASTGDANVNWHVMASGASWGLSMTQRATRDRFFSVHASRRLLGGALQPRNAWNTLKNLNGGVGAGDLAYARLASPTSMQWLIRLSTTTIFGAETTWSGDAGDAADIFMTGDVDGDGRADLVYGRIVSADQVRWYVRRSTGSSWSDFDVWANDAGDAGDIFRMGDVNGDGRADLVYGRPLTSTTVRWYVRLSTGTGFPAWTIWSNDAGNEGDHFFVSDIDADGDGDLVYGRVLSDSQVKWWVRRSNHTGFGSLETWREDAGDRGDQFFVADTGGDGDADLLYGRTHSDTNVSWYFRAAEGTHFGNYTTWASDAGDAGDLFRLSDGDGDRYIDLFYGRPLGMASLVAAPDLTLIRWFGRRSLGGSFGAYTTWSNDAGDEGDAFP